MTIAGEHQSAASGGRQRIGRRPIEVWTLTAMNLLFSILAFASTQAPITQHQFVRLGILFGVVFFLIAIVVWLFANRFREFVLPIAAIVGAGTTSAIVAVARTPEGTLLTCFIYLWTAIYSSSFFRLRILLVVLMSIAIGCLSALIANGIGRWPAIWLLLMVTTWSPALILERAMTRLRVEAETDALTGLLNRRGFLKAAAVERSVAERIGLRLAIVVIDLDHFKEVNDSEGHVAGDRVLVAVSAAWRRQMRAGDLLCRFGGDEFVMLLADSSDDAIQVVLERCRQAHPIEWTAGIAGVHPGEDFEEAIRAADAELYQNKMRRLAERMPDRRALG